MLTLVLGAAVLVLAVVGMLFLTRRPGGELQREHQLYAENRPVLRLDPSLVPPNLRHLVPLAEKWGMGGSLHGRPGGAGRDGIFHPGGESHPPIVTHLHYEFEGWSGDDLLTTFPEFIVTENLARALERSGLTGFRLTPVETSAGGMWLQMHEDRPLPDRSLERLA